MASADDDWTTWTVILAVLVVLGLAGLIGYIVWDVHRDRDRVDVTHMRVEVADYYKALVEIGYAQDKVDRHSVYFQSDHEASLRWWVTTCRMNARVYNANVAARGKLAGLPARLEPEGCRA